MFHEMFHEMSACTEGDSDLTNIQIKASKLIQCESICGRYSIMCSKLSYGADVVKVTSGYHGKEGHKLPNFHQEAGI